MGEVCSMMQSAMGISAERPADHPRQYPQHHQQFQQQYQMQQYPGYQQQFQQPYYQQMGQHPQQIHYAPDQGYWQSQPQQSYGQHPQSRGAVAWNEDPHRAPAQLQSQLQGRRRSLLVGINYEGTNAALSGCKADVIRMRDFLVQYGGFPCDKESQIVLVEDRDHAFPTRDNMIRCFRWLAEGAQPGDILFFHYSGHGGRVENSRQADGYSETLCPLDYDTNGQIYDEEMFEILVKPLPSGVKLTVILDACHSAGALNLPYLFTGTAENLAEARQNLVNMAMSKNWAANLAALADGRPMAALQDLASLGLGAWALYKQGQQQGQDGYRAEVEENVGLAVGEVVCFSGCRSDQTSADVGNVGAQFEGVDAVGMRRDSLGGVGGKFAVAGGALTSCFIETMSQQENLTYITLLDRIRQRLSELGFSQVPQLSSSMALELNQPFSMDRITLPGDPSQTGSKSTSAVSGFMANLTSNPLGQTLAQNSRALDGSAPWKDPAVLAGFAATAVSALGAAGVAMPWDNFVIGFGSGDSQGSEHESEEDEDTQSEEEYYRD